MTDTPTERGEEGAWAKLHRRKAVQWGLAYVAAAWALLQGIGFLDDAFHWPDFAKQVETIDLAVGLPIVPVVARVSRRSWPAAHEREATSKGKTEPHSNLAGGQSRDQRPSRATTLKCGCEYGEDAVKALCPAHMAEWNETHGRWAEQCRRMDGDGGR